MCLKQKKTELEYVTQNCKNLELWERESFSLSIARYNWKKSGLKKKRKNALI